uniref:Uncharacterized protein n=1 Tax=Enterococcus faecalis TaxID=1351 RepID=A0A2H4HIB0_ENTFL|nr:Hypothetical protein [Enterococcus faecalis]
MNRKESGKVKLATLFLGVKALVTMTKTTDETMTKSRYYIMTENRSKMDFFVIAKNMK